MQQELQQLHNELLAHDGEKFISIATTANVNNPNFFIGSSRLTEDTVTGNIILKDASLLKEIYSYFSSIASLFLIDCEVKNGIDLASIARELIPIEKLHF